MNYSDNKELEKSAPHIIVEISQYVPNAVLSKTIIKKATGNITVSSFDAGEEIIDGTAGLTLQGKKYNLKLGEGIIIPAHAKHKFDAKEQFKMISTIIKSGYEDFNP
jgi:mannose-6-phosphate isomerase class I